MTNITGKIYQQTNAAGTENRFPRTVIEAVYGLSSYLQTQFGNLANIYMPIEGITESKPGQEFVYRKSPATIKAKSLSLDRIYGKTLAWNQMMNLRGVTTQTLDGVTITNNNDGTIGVSGSASGDYAVFNVTGILPLLKHKYIIKQSLPFGAEDPYEGIDVCLYTGSVYALDKVDYDAKGVIYDNSNTNIDGYAISVRVKGGHLVNIPKVYCIFTDLTLMFGEGHEPSTVAEFESMFPGYHSYEPGKLISNDAESIETVGFNLWDEEWELGTINSSGQPASSSNIIRSKNYIPVPAGTDNLFCSSSQLGDLYCYDANQSYLGIATYTSSSGGFICGLRTNTAFVKFRTPGTTYNHDICINISDSSKNGTYEPHKKSVLGLNLNSIKVYSPNIWDEEWELGTWVNGVKTASSENIRCKNYIPIPSGVGSVYVKGASGKYIFVYCLDSNKNQIGQRKEISGSSSVTIDSGTKYIVFHLGSDYGTTYNNDITINKSDPAFNGRYFPHGILTITGGLKGAGTVYDEIVGTKLYRRLGRVDLEDLTVGKVTSILVEFAGLQGAKSGTLNAVCAKYPYSSVYAVSESMDNKSFLIYGSNVYIKDEDFSSMSGSQIKSAMSGVYLDYELANVEVYDLAEPLVLTMKAGTTEARVSPNAYGLSAPFCADITYSASENNDSASAQYALTAGRLLNSHKLWGQDFNGEQDITGPLDDVTRINNLLYLVNGNVGIGQSNPQYKLDVAGTFRATGNSVFNGTLGVSGNLDTYGGITLAGATWLSWKDSGNTARSTIGFNSGNNTFYVGYGTAGAGYSSRFEGYDITFCYGTSHSTGIVLSSSGNVAIGPITPSYKLDVDGDGRFVHSGYDVLTLKRSTNAGVAILFANTNGNLGELSVSSSKALTYSPIGANTYDVYHSGNSNLTTVPWSASSLTLAGAISGATSIDSLLYLNTTNSRVGIGVSSPTEKLDVDGGIHAVNIQYINNNNGYWVGYTGAGLGNNDTGLMLYTYGTNPIRCFVDGVECARIAGSGNVGIGKTSPSYKLDVNGTFRASGAATFGSTIHATGGIDSDSYVTAGAAASSSDASLKNNIQSISHDKALYMLYGLRGCEWDWNDKKPALTGQHGSGLVAQEVMGVMPWAVLDVNGEYSLNYNSLWGIAIPVMQSHEERLKEAERRIEALENENAELKARLNA